MPYARALVAGVYETVSLLAAATTCSRDVVRSYHAFAPPKLEPPSSIPGDTANGISLLLHSASSVPGLHSRARWRSSWLCCAVGMPAAQRPMSRHRWPLVRSSAPRARPLGGVRQVSLTLFTAGVVLEALHALGGRAGTCSGNERGVGEEEEGGEKVKTSVESGGSRDEE